MVKRKKEATVLSGAVNLLNTIIGAGILSIPFAIARQGLIFGTFLLIFVAFLTHYSMVMLGKVIKETGAVNFGDIEEGLKKVIPARKADMLAINLKAIEAGYNL